MWKPSFGAGLGHAASPARGGRGFLRGRRVFSLYPGVEGDAIWWENGRIREVGAAGTLARSVPASTPTYDLPDALITPGLVDGHTHLGLWAVNRRRLQLSGTASHADVITAVAGARPVQGWVVGQGWDANRWGTSPNRHQLDRVQQAPVYLDSLDVHAAWVNTAALERAGITRETPDPFGGKIVRDGNGDPTGLLLERAVELVNSVLPEPPPAELETALLEAQAEAHRLGITGVHDVEGLNTLAAFRRLEAREALRLRVLFHPPVATLDRLIAERIRSGDSSDWLTIGGVKMFLDGSLGSQTAWMLQPYAGSSDRGMPITSESEARSAMHHATAAGLATTVHAIGDAAVRRALDLVEQLPTVALPHRIEHFQCVHPTDLGRAARAGIVVSMQPAHLLTDVPLVDRYWGDRGGGAYAFATLLRQGTPLVFGSDVPVASIDPRQGIYAALERRELDGGPSARWRTEERISFAQALRGYTANAAAAGGVSQRRGKLAPGFDADLVAWSMDPAAERDDGEAVRSGHALLTVVAGEVVMQR